MKPLFFAAFLLIATSIVAQKRYDCIIRTSNSIPNEYRLVGALKQINDSSIVLLMRNSKDTVLNWADLRAVKFKIRNGFMRTVMPIALFAGVSVGALAVSSNSNNSDGCSCLSSGKELVTAIVFPLVFTTSLAVGTPTYFILRNKRFYINNYEDFKNLKLASNKYLIK